MQPVSHTDHRRPGSSRHRTAIIASVAFHVALIGTLLIWYFPAKPPTVPQAAVARMAEVDIRTAAPTKPGDSEAASSDAASPETSPRDRSPSADVPPDQVDSAIRSAIEQTASVSDEKKLSELQKNVSKIDQVASEKSIEEIGSLIQTATGLPPRASGPAEGSIDGPFDFDTAQFHDVTREAATDGQWKYRSVMVDADGRTIDVELGPEEGKTAYDAMQMVKKSPFAETIYRSMVMPMLDKMIPRPLATERPSGLPQAAAAPAPETQP
jgi:hypothetical protein